MKRLAWTLTLALACGAAAAVETPAKAASGDDAANQMVCFIEPSTGSHIKKRVCMTRAEREARTRQDQDTMRNAQRPGSAKNAPQR